MTLYMIGGAFGAAAVGRDCWLLYSCTCVWPLPLAGRTQKSRLRCPAGEGGAGTWSDGKLTTQVGAFLCPCCGRPSAEQKQGQAVGWSPTCLTIKGCHEAAQGMQG